VGLGHRVVQWPGESVLDRVRDINAGYLKRHATANCEIYPGNAIDPESWLFDIAELAKKAKEPFVHDVIPIIAGSNEKKPCRARRVY